MQKYFKLATFYLIIGLVMGIFYREFTKFNNFTGVTALKGVHTHALVLGFLFFILVLLLDKSFNISSRNNFKKWIISYNIGLVYLLSSLTYRGILQVQKLEISGLSHIAGLGHTILGISLVWFCIIVNKSLAIYDSKSKVI